MLIKIKVSSEKTLPTIADECTPEHCTQCPMHAFIGTDGCQFERMLAKGVELVK